MSETIDEAPGGSGRSRLPWGCVGMLGLVLAAELVVSGAALDVLRPEFWLWYATGRSARHDAAGAQVLCLGTSQTSYGVVPQVLQERLGRSVYNLAMCAGPPQTDYFLLKRVLAAGGRPGAVVLDLHPHLMAVDYWGSIQFYPNLLSVGEVLDLAWTVRDPDVAARVLLARALPSVLGRVEMRKTIQAALEGHPRSTRRATLNQLWNRESNRGALVFPRRTTAPAELDPIEIEWCAPDTWRHVPTNTLYVRRMLKLAAEYQIKVFLLIPPIDPRLQQLRDRRGLASAFEEYARGLQAHHANLVVVEASHSNYPPSVFHDAMHVTRPGAIALSSDLAEVIRPHLDPHSPPLPHWVALPAYRDRSTTARVEELTIVKQTSPPWTTRR